MELKAGTVNAIVGPSGSGKSTIAKLIASLWDVDFGSIKIGGVDVKEMALADFNRKIAYVAQDNYLFKDVYKRQVKRCLRPNGRLILRDVTSDNKVLVWLMNTLEMPLANICGHGDVRVPTRDMVMKCCRKAGLKVEKFETRKGMRMHCVVRKSIGEGDRQ